MRKEITGLMLSLALIAPAVANASIWDFGGALNSNQETHPLVLPSPYFGGGLLTAELDDITGQFVMTVGFFGLTGAPIAAHIHPGAPGVAGPPLIDLGAPSGSILGIPTYELDTTLTAPQIADLTGNGHLGLGAVTDWYVNIHTPNNQGGEIRGQLFVTASPVPVPAAAWMMLSAIGTAFGIRRKA